MTCEELRDEYGPWALGIAEDPARSEIAEHLARQCPACMPVARNALATAAAMSGAVTLADPPRHLRSRIIAMVAPEPKRFLLVLVLAGYAAFAIVLWSLVLPLWRQNKQQAQDATRLAQALTILNDPVAKDVTFGDPAARGRVFVSPKGVVLIAANLPKLEGNHTFELWIITSAGNAAPAGTFHSETISPGTNSEQGAVYVYRGATSNAAAVAVTVEPEGGSPQPTTKPFIVSKL